MSTIIQLRRDTSTNWTSNNPVLAQGELGLETNTSKMKIGDGTTAWNSLAYIIDNSQWSGKEELFRYSTMPTASSTYLGKIVEYTGTTDTNYTNGYFYKCTVADDVYSWTQCDVQPDVEVINTVQSTSATSALSANMGKELQAQITHLQGIGRFLALWNSSTGLPATDPTTSPYTYKTGDYFIIGTLTEGGTNYKPSGTSYTTGVASTTVETETIKVGNTYYFDGTNWTLQAGGGGGTITDVQVNGTSVVTSGVANVPKATNSTLGAVRGNVGSGTNIAADGSIWIYPADTGTIAAKASIRQPICPSNLDYAVKVGVTTNTITLTDSEKSAAQTWLGTNTMNIEYSDGTSGSFAIVGTLS